MLDLEQDIEVGSELGFRFSGVSKVNAMIQFFYSLFVRRERQETIRRRLDEAMKQARRASCRNDGISSCPMPTL